MFPIRQDHASTEQKYQLIREIVYEEIEKEFPIQARPITLNECHKANRWETMTDSDAREKRGGWDWAELYRAYINKPNRFEIALLSGGNLGALAYGQRQEQDQKFVWTLSSLLQSDLRL